MTTNEDSRQSEEPQKSVQQPPSDNPFADREYQPFAKDYLKELLTNIRDLDQRTRRSTLLTVTLATVYFIAHNNPQSSVTVFSLRLDDLSPLLAVIPVVTAYQFTTIAFTEIEAAAMARRAWHVLEAAYPRLVKEDDDDKWFSSLLPGDAALFGPSVLGENHALSNIRFVLVLFGPVVVSAIETYLYGDRVGWGSASFIVCTAVSLILITAGAWAIFTIARREN